VATFAISNPILEPLHIYFSLLKELNLKFLLREEEFEPAKKIELTL
jgi:hypothetical protein